LINKFNFQNEYKLAPLIILILKDKWPFPLSYTKMEKHSIHMAYNRKTYIFVFSIHVILCMYKLASDMPYYYLGDILAVIVW
jgi:hypothetical protein